MTHLDDTKGPETAPDLDELDKPVRNPHDAAFKVPFKKLNLARGFFENFLPAHLGRRMDLDHLRLEPGSYVDETLRDRHSDLEYSTRFSGRKGWL